MPARISLYDRLFNQENAEEAPDGQDFLVNLNPSSLEVLDSVMLEPSLSEAVPGVTYQFERQGYFCMDLDSLPGSPVFNRTVTLKDTWAKIEKTQQAA